MIKKMMEARASEIDTIISIVTDEMTAPTLREILSKRAALIREIAFLLADDTPDATPVARRRLVGYPRGHSPVWTPQRVELMRTMREEHGSTPNQILEALNRLEGPAIGSRRTVISMLSKLKIYKFGDRAGAEHAVIMNKARWKDRTGAVAG